jgi:hypothetical protein
VMILRRTLVYLGMRDDGPPTVAISISRRVAATVAAALGWASTTYTQLLVPIVGEEVPTAWTAVGSTDPTCVEDVDW